MYMTTMQPISTYTILDEFQTALEMKCMEIVDLFGYYEPLNFTLNMLRVVHAVGVGIYAAQQEPCFCKDRGSSKLVPSLGSIVQKLYNTASPENEVFTFIACIKYLWIGIKSSTSLGNCMNVNVPYIHTDLKIYNVWFHCTTQNIVTAMAKL